MRGLTIDKIAELGLLYENSKAKAKEIASENQPDEEINFVER